MRLTGSLAQGETPNNDEATDFLARLNDLIDGYSTEPLMQFTRNINQYALTPNVSTYAIGLTAAAPFNVARPVKIERARFLQANTNLGFELDIYNADEWQSIVEKTNVAQVPKILYPDYAVPNMNLNLNPVPQLGGSLELTTWQTIQQYALLTSVVSLAPGFSEALQYGLALRIATELGMPLDPIIVQAAIQFKARIEQFNAALIGGLSEGTPPAPAQTEPPTVAQPAAQ